MHNLVWLLRDIMGRMIGNNAKITYNFFLKKKKKKKLLITLPKMAFQNKVAHSKFSK